MDIKAIVLSIIEEHPGIDQDSIYIEYFEKRKLKVKPYDIYTSIDSLINESKVMKIVVRSHSIKKSFYFCVEHIISIEGFITGC